MARKLLRLQCHCCGARYPMTMLFSPNTIAYSIIDKLDSPDWRKVSMEDLIEHVYGKNPRGGPVSAFGVIRTNIQKLRSVLRYFDLDIEMTKEGPAKSFYQLVDPFNALNSAVKRDFMFVSSGGRDAH